MFDSMLKREYFECSCGDVSHTLCIEVYECKVDKEISLAAYTQMNGYLPWYRRVAEAVKYIFNHYNRASQWNAHWDVCIFDETDKLNKFYETIKYAKETKDRYEVLVCQEKEDALKQANQIDGSSI